MSRIAIILARGGSKRLPRKNVLPINGRPMLAWSVDAALESRLFDQVLVSTDDEAIAEVARAWGAMVPFLRDSAADDLASSSQATCAALLQAQDYWACTFDVVAQLMANCPLRDADDIREAVAHFDDAGAPAQISCFKFGWMNPWWAMTLESGGQPQYLHPHALQSRSQDLPTLYCPTGALWLARSAALLEHGTFYTPGHIFHPMSWISAVDVDDAEDLQMAKAAFQFKPVRRAD